MYLNFKRRSKRHKTQNWPRFILRFHKPFFSTHSRVVISPQPFYLFPLWLFLFIYFGVPTRQKVAAVPRRYGAALGHGVYVYSRAMGTDGRLWTTSRIQVISATITIPPFSSHLRHESCLIWNWRSGYRVRPHRKLVIEALKAINFLVHFVPRPPLKGTTDRFETFDEPIPKSAQRPGREGDKTTDNDCWLPYEVGDTAISAESFDRTIMTKSPRVLINITRG